LFDGKFATTFNGVNDQGDIVGFYVNSKGNTIGLLARPTPADNAFQDSWSLLGPKDGAHSTTLAIHETSTVPQIAVGNSS
jgi:hypothetical protein